MHHRDLLAESCGKPPHHLRGQSDLRQQQQRRFPNGKRAFDQRFKNGSLAAARHAAQQKASGCIVLQARSDPVIDRLLLPGKNDLRRIGLRLRQFLRRIGLGADDRTALHQIRHHSARHAADIAQLLLGEGAEFPQGIGYLLLLRGQGNSRRLRGQRTHPDLLPLDTHLRFRLALQQPRFRQQRHLDALLVGHAVHKFQQHLLRHLYLGVALPSVPHRV